MAEYAGHVRRREDPRLITGAGSYVDDLQIAGCLHAAMLRSPHAHARLRAIDTAAARRRPGVLGVFTLADLGAAGAPIPIYAPHPALPRPCPIRPLCGDRVRFVGETVAVVIAEDPYRAYDALEAIRVDYEPLPPLVDVEAALAPGAPVLHEEIGSNVVTEWRQQVGDAAAAIRWSRGGWLPAGRAIVSPCTRPCRWSTATAASSPATSVFPRITSASSRRPTWVEASAPRACTTPSTSR